MSARTVLVTGASGMLGGAVAAALRDRGDTVRAFQRRPAGIEGVQDVQGSLSEPADVRRAVRGTDAVIHLAAKVSISGPEHEYRAINIDGTRHVVEAMAGQGGDLVNVSSVGGGAPGPGDRRPRCHPADPERARPRPHQGRRRYWPWRPGTGMAVTSVRPRGVGPGTPAGGRSSPAPPPGVAARTGMALIDTTYVTNAAGDGGVGPVGEVHGESFVVTNGEPRTVRDVFAGFCDAAGVPRPRLHVPGALGRLAGRVVEKVWEVRPGSDEPPMTEFLAEQLSTAHWFDQRRTRERLKWTPSVTMDEGFERLAAWYRENPFPG